MPNVNGKKFAYTPAGMAAAKKEARKVSKKVAIKKPAVKKAMIKKMSNKAY